MIAALPIPTRVFGDTTNRVATDVNLIVAKINELVALSALPWGYTAVPLGGATPSFLLSSDLTTQGKGRLSLQTISSQPSTGTYQIVCDGNSLTAGYGSSTQEAAQGDVIAGTRKDYPAQLKGLFGNSQQFFVTKSYGVNGQSTQAMIADAATQIDPNISSAYTKNIILAWELTNEFTGNGSTKEQTFDYFKQYCLARKAAGWAVIIGNFIKRTSYLGNRTQQEEDAAQAYLNQRLQTEYTQFADVLVDLNALNLQNTTGWDGTHPSDDGYLLIAQAFKDAIVSYVSTPTLSLNALTGADTLASNGVLTISSVVPAAGQYAALVYRTLDSKSIPLATWFPGVTTPVTPPSGFNYAEFDGSTLQFPANMPTFKTLAFYLRGPANGAHSNYFLLDNRVNGGQGFAYGNGINTIVATINGVTNSDTSSLSKFFTDADVRVILDGTDFIAPKMLTNEPGNPVRLWKMVAYNRVLTAAEKAAATGDFPTNGVIGSWKFEDMTATTIPDGSGNGYAITVNGTPGTIH